MSVQDTTVGGKYVVGPKIGSGSFGEVYIASELGVHEIYALKKEEEKSKNSRLSIEAKIIKSLEGQVGFMRCHWQGIENKSNMMVIDLLGPSLDDLHGLCGRKFSLKTTLMLADQMIQRIEVLHSKNFIHRDIKPENFLMGLRKQSHIVYLIDYGLSKRYRDSKNLQHIPYKENKNLTGTARYASINSHLGIEQSRRDDLEGVGYVLLYLCQGYLPWQGLRANNKIEKYQKIMEKKMSLPVEIQCKGLPIEFSTYLNYCRALKFNEKPDYAFLRRLFLGVMERENYEYNFDYDWCHMQTSKTYNNGKVKLQIHSKKVQSDEEEKNQKQEENINLLQASNVNSENERDRSGVSSSPRKSSNNEQDCVFEDGEQNIVDEEIVEQTEKNPGTAREIDLEDKKNRLLYDELE